MMKLKREKSLGQSQEVFESIIGPSMQVQGNLLISKGVRIDGCVDGNVLQQEGHNAIVAISENALVTGDVRANSVIVSGHLKGNIFSNTRVELLKTARIEGNISYSSIGMEIGATINGGLNQFENENLAQDVINRVKQKA
ncbi:MAG: polymer-forming cytoskeletal protein [Betaproteobacteria bacterium]|jgi:cytoskeletal protein CcmA (bactofilin family)